MNFNADFVDVLNSLPNDIVGQITLLKEKDALAHAIFGDLQSKTKEVLNGDDSDCYDLFKKALGIYEEKLAISTQMEDLVSSNIKRIQEDLIRLSESEQSPPVPTDNEVRYCYCQQPASGEMVGCDADNCPLEWFHLACTDLIKIPSGKWYCDYCVGKRRMPIKK